MIAADGASAPAMALIHAASFAPAARWDEPALRSLLAMPGVDGLVSDRGGFILTRRAADEAEVLTLAVVPPARGTGLGRDLLAAAMTRLTAGGVLRMFLEVAETNQAAIRLYRAASFTCVARRPGYYQDGIGALVMRRELPV